LVGLSDNRSLLESYLEENHKLDHDLVGARTRSQKKEVAEGRVLTCLNCYNSWTYRGGGLGHTIKAYTTCAKCKKPVSLR
jgi:hypothetical protein